MSPVSFTRPDPSLLSGPFHGIYGGRGKKDSLFLDHSLISRPLYLSHPSLPPARPPPRVREGVGSGRGWSAQDLRRAVRLDWPVKDTQPSLSTPRFWSG